MKRLLGVLGISIFLFSFGFGCAGSADSSGDSAESNSSAPSQEAESPSPSPDVLEIDERLFIAQTNDIFTNTDEYLGKSIKYQGLFKTHYWNMTDKYYYYVIRYGPGCCANDGEAGFEVAWDGERPEENDWCEVVGTLEFYEDEGETYLRLVLSSLEVLEERGQEYVTA